MLKKIVAAAGVAGMLIIGMPTVAQAVPGPNSITSCVITDGTTTNSTFPLNVSDGVEPSLTTVSMVPTPASGKSIYTQNGFRNKTTGEFIVIGGGTGDADNPGYQPPGDPGYWVATQRFPNYPEYPASEWEYEFQWWGVLGAFPNLTPDTSGEPFCKIVIIVAPADSTAPTITGNENPSVAPPTTEVATYTADEIVEWSITGGADQNLFEIDPITGALSFKSASANGTYTVIITATDAANNTNTITITVTVAVPKLATTGIDADFSVALASLVIGALMLGGVLIRRRRGVSRS